MKTDWKRKLTSRKFWVAVAGMISGIVLAFSGKGDAAQTVSGVVMQIASVVGYVLGEGLTDAAAIGKDERSDDGG